MSARFVDTNILLYSVDADPLEARKRTIARQILREAGIAFSVQVLQEFYVQALRPTRRYPLRHADAVSFIFDWCRFPVKEMDVGLLMAALRTKDRFNLSYWDAAIIEAARALGCGTVLTEDLNDGQDYGGVRVENPFRV